MPLGARHDRVTGNAGLKTLQLQTVTLRQAQFLSLLLPEVGFLLMLGLDVDFFVLVCRHSASCKVGQVVIFRGSLYNQHCGRLHRTSPALPRLHKKKICFLGCTTQLILFASFFVILILQLSDRRIHHTVSCDS